MEISDNKLISWLWILTSVQFVSEGWFDRCLKLRRGNSVPFITLCDCIAAVWWIHILFVIWLCMQIWKPFSIFYTYLTNMADCVCGCDPPNLSSAHCEPLSSCFWPYNKLLLPAQENNTHKDRGYIKKRQASGEEWSKGRYRTKTEQMKETQEGICFSQNKPPNVYLLMLTKKTERKEAMFFLLLSSHHYSILPVLCPWDNDGECWTLICLYRNCPTVANSKWAQHKEAALVKKRKKTVCWIFN